MKNVRIIPRLDVKGPNVVKGIHLEGLRVVGKPAELAKKYYDQGADEILYIDIVASLYERNNLSDVVKDAISLGVFVPMTVGGGVRSLEDIQKLLNAGADKVAINTAATRNPSLITEASKRFGSQCIVGSIEAKKCADNKWEAYIDNGREKTGLDAIEWAQKLVELGAGELLVTSIDQEGTEKGYELELIKKISESVFVPVIACGGAGSSKDIAKCISETGCDAISFASIIHYNKSSIQDIKQELENQKIPLRANKEIERKNENRVGVNKTISIIDYGVGNIMSVISAFEKIGCNVKIVSTQEEVATAQSLILPGVGAFAEGMRNLEKRKLIEPIKQHIAANKPLLGICLGAQLLMSESEEFGNHKGLDIIKGKVIGFKNPKEVSIPGYRVPHIMWNSIYQRGNKTWDASILSKTHNAFKAYFIHSFYIVPEDSNAILATANYGNQEFCAVVKKENVYGCQFHPEKSGEGGLQIIREFAQLE